MTTTKQELLSKFALQTGAELPGVQSNSSQINQINNNTIADNTTESKIAQDEELFKDSFTDRTKVPPWQHPKYKVLIVSLCVIPAALAVGLIFKNGVPKPKLETKAPHSAPVVQDPNDRPKPATDGEWASYASTNGMRQQFASAAGSENADALKKIQARTNTQKKVQGSSSTAKPNTRLVPTTPATRTHVSTDGASIYRYANTYSTPASPPVSVTRSRTVAPVVRSFDSSLHSPKHSPVSIDTIDNSQQRLQSPRQQQSPQERITAMLAATSTENSSERSAPAAGDNSTRSAPLIANVSSSTLPQPTFAPQPIAYLPSEAAVIDGQPQMLIDSNQSAKGILLTSIAFTSGDYASLADQPVEIELSEALGNIPAGARIDAVVDKDDRSSNAESKKVVRLKPIAVVVGNMKIPLPNDAIALSGKNGDPLIAKKKGRSFLKVVGGLAGTVAGSAIITNFGAAQNVEIGESSYFKSIGANIATNLVSSAAQQLQRSEEGYDRVLTLKAGTSVKISVRKPITLPAIAIRKQAKKGDAADETQN